MKKKKKKKKKNGEYSRAIIEVTITMRQKGRLLLALAGVKKANRMIPDNY